MSGDRFSKCPSCIARVTREDKEQLELVKVQYGKIPAEEFTKKMHDAQQKRNIVDTMREDWEFVFDYDDLALRIAYGCRCLTCGFEFSHLDTVPIPKESIDVEAQQVPAH